MREVLGRGEAYGAGNEGGDDFRIAFVGEVEPVACEVCEANRLAVKEQFGEVEEEARSS